MAFTCSALADMPAPPRAEPAERPLLLSYAPADDAPPDDFVASDFVASDFVASEDLVSLGLAEGEVVPLAAPLADGDVSVFVSLAEGELPLLSPLVVPAAAPDDDEPVDPLGPCASAGAATNAKATASA